MCPGLRSDHHRYPLKNSDEQNHSETVKSHLIDLHQIPGTTGDRENIVDILKTAAGAGHYGTIYDES